MSVQRNDTILIQGVVWPHVPIYIALQVSSLKYFTLGFSKFPNQTVLFCSQMNSACHNAAIKKKNNVEISHEESHVCSL